MQDDLTVLFLGAGFSRCITNGQAPLMPGYFAALDVTQYAKLADFIAEGFGGVASAKFQDVVCALDQSCDVPWPADRRERILGDLNPEELLADIDRYSIARLAELEWSVDHYGAPDWWDSAVVQAAE
jgi:hypothetical protein